VPCVWPGGLPAADTLSRPDVLPPPVLQELSKLQDRIEPFSTTGVCVYISVLGGGGAVIVCPGGGGQMGAEPLVG